MSWKRNRRAALLCLIFASILLAAAITILQYTSLSKNPEVISEITQAPLSVPLPVRATSVSEASHASLETQYDLIASIVFPSDRVHNIRLSACIALIVAAGFALLSAFLTPAALTVRLADLLPSAPPLALLSFARPLSGGTVFSWISGSPARLFLVFALLALGRALFLAFLLFCIHRFVLWLKKKAPLEGTLVGRLSLRIQRRSGKAFLSLALLLIGFFLTAAIFCGLLLSQRLNRYASSGSLRLSGVSSMLTFWVLLLVLLWLLFLLWLCIRCLYAQLSACEGLQKEAVARAIEEERFRVDLITNVSHDLRTPLTSIIGYGQLLEKEALPEPAGGYLASLNLKALYMRELVDDLFELTKVESGILKASAEPLDLIRLLEQTVALFDDQLKVAGLTVVRHYEQDSLRIVSDGTRLHQIFANLFSNAVKYALPGTRLHLSLETAEEITVKLVNVANYPMDFDPKQITARFVRGDVSRTGSGSGLGLAIASTYAASLGGSFHAEVSGEQFSAVVTLPRSDSESDHTVM